MKRKTATLYLGLTTGRRIPVWRLNNDVAPQPVTVRQEVKAKSAR